MIAKKTPTQYHKSCLTHLEHIQGTTLVALTNHKLADKARILGHQHVLEAVDLKGKVVLTPNHF